MGAKSGRVGSRAYHPVCSISFHEKEDALGGAAAGFLPNGMCVPRRCRTKILSRNSRPAQDFPRFSFSRKKEFNRVKIRTWLRLPSQSSPSAPRLPAAPRRTTTTASASGVLGYRGGLQWRRRGVLIRSMGQIWPLGWKSSAARAGWAARGAPSEEQPPPQLKREQSTVCPSLRRISERLTALDFPVCPAYDYSKATNENYLRAASW